MALIITRRTFNAARNKFTNNVADVTRFAWFKKIADKKYSGGSIDKEDWLHRLAHHANGQGVVIYVHGFNNTQLSMLERLDLIEAGLKASGFGGAVIGYDWPSKGSEHAYDDDKRTAKKVAPFFVPEALRPVHEKVAGQPVSLICHSMGSYLALRALSGEGAHPGLTSCDLDQVLFVSADLDREALRKNAWGALVMEQWCSKFTNYYSADDKVLRLSKLINGMKKRAGRAGLPDLKPANAIDVETTQQFRKHIPPGDQDNLRLSHNWYYRDAGFLRDACLTMQGQSAGSMPTRQTGPDGKPVLLT